MTAISTQAHICPEKKKKLGVGQIILIIVMMLFVLICTLPFINVIAMSMSSKSAILRGAVSFWPVEFNVDAYKLIVSDNSMWHSLLYTIELTVIYTVLAMVMTILVAFPLSMRRLKGQRVIMFFIVFTMYFSGGTIPIYLNVKEFGMLDSMWSLIIPGLISTFNVIILKNFFSSLPYELVEAASIDGATDFQVLTRIFLPLSFSSLATLSLFYAVGKWNSFNDALYYMMEQKNMIVAPSKAVNAGGVGVSALEMAQNSERLVWTEEEVDAQLQKMMQNIHKVSVEAAEEYGLGYNLVAGANLAGFKKVADAMMAQGAF